MSTTVSKVRRAEILDLATYEKERPAIRQRVLDIKSKRRIHLGDHLTLLFENADTMRYQIQEMLRIEKREAEADIQHEIDTYNEVLGGPGELGCTLLIEIDDERERQEKLLAWHRLPEHLYAELPDGTRVAPRFDRRQVGDERLSSVQYLIFPCAEAPVAFGTTLRVLELRTELTPEQRQALADDLD